MTSDTFDTFPIKIPILPGKAVESGNAIWQGNGNLRAINGRAKGKGLDEWLIGQIPFDMGTRDFMVIEARMRQQAPGYQFLGFSSYAEAPFTQPPAAGAGEPPHESVYFRYQKSGDWAIFTRQGSSIAFLPSGAAPQGWTVGTPHVYKMIYIASSNSIEVYRDAILIASATLPFTPNLRFVGFQGRDTGGGVYAGSDGWVDDFKVETRDFMPIVLP